jgi:8-oxo-dGTP pyrophosphatase MutT (NUDIX family)
LKAFPISIKGVLLVDGGVVLVKNPRNEWELPGGRIEAGETPENTLVREFEEELSVRVSVEAPIDSYLFEVVPEKNVFIITYGCALAGEFKPRLSDEHSEYCVCAVKDLPNVNLPRGYRESVERWSNAV